MDLATRRDTFRNTLRSILRPTNIPAALALFVIVIAALFAEYQNRRVYEQNLRADVLGRVSSIRNRLEGDINGNIQLLRGLIATLSTEPQMKQDRFAQLAANLLTEKSKLRNIAAAPDMVISLMYPLKGNEQAIGLDYRKNPAQREAALRARDSGEPIVAGPVDLVQGGRGFIARLPVFIGDGHGGKTFWGIVSAVIDVDSLYRDSGLLDKDLPIEIAITGRDAKGVKGARFFGSADAAQDNPVVADVVLPSGSWQIAAVPRSGWHVTPSNVWKLRLFILLAGGLIMVPTVMTGRLIGERMNNIGELKRREIAAAAPVSPARAGPRHLADRRLGNEHRDRRTGLGRPHERIVRLSRRWRPAQLCALGARAASRRHRPRAPRISSAPSRPTEATRPSTACCSTAASCATSARAAWSTGMPGSRPGSSASTGTSPRTSSCART